MNKIENLIELAKLNEFLGKKEDKKEIEEKKSNTLWIVLGIIAAVAVVAGIAYAIYRHCTPDYLDDFDEDFEDIEEEDFFEDESLSEE